jgi:CRP/FNR family transcriptional regulator, cyclic AMP receptor protein
MEDFGPGERERLLQRFGKRLTAGQVIYREGDLGSEAYLLQEGRVRLIKRIRSAERSLTVLRPGDLFGESAFIAGSPRSSTAIALSDGMALAFDNATFQNLLENNRPVAARIVQQLVRRLRDAEDQIEIMMLRDTQSRIVNALLKLAQQTPLDARGAALLQVSPMELSTRIGMDVETVKRGVQKLREGQYLRVVDERVEIPDVDSLKRLFALLGLKDEIQGADGVPAPDAERRASGRAPA